MTKNELIQQHIDAFYRGEFKVGDLLDKTGKKDCYYIKTINRAEQKVKLQKDVSFYEVTFEELFKDYKPSCYIIGENPFLQFSMYPSAFSLDHYLYKMEKDQIDFNPFVTINGEKIYYQRPFVWTLDQKRQLIRSCFNGLPIGAVIVQEYEWEKEQELGKAIGIVDGQQRLKTLWEFYNDGFEVDGVVYSEMSGSAQSRYGNVSLPQMKVQTKDEKEILNLFIRIAKGGTDQTEEHLNHLKSYL